MRAYVIPKEGLNVRAAASLNAAILRALPYNAEVEVDKIQPMVWSKLLNQSGYVMGTHLSPTPLNYIWVSPLSARRYHLHASAGGWPPTPDQQRIVKNNRIASVFICTYESHTAGENLSGFRAADVEYVVLRATAPIETTNNPNLWADIAISRLAPFMNILGTRVMVQVHNEPNLVDEGWRHGWKNGVEFGRWFTVVSRRIRDAFKGVRIGFSPMSPGGAIVNRRSDELSFVAGCYTAIRDSDWVAVHNYYGNTDASDLTVPINKWRSYAQGKAIVCTEGGPSEWHVAAASGLQRMFSLHAAVNVPVFAWLLDNTEQPSFAGAAWTKQNIILPAWGTVNR